MRHYFNIYKYISGYPYLDEEILDKKGFESISDVWIKQGVTKTVKFWLKENNLLFNNVIEGKTIV